MVDRYCRHLCRSKPPVDNGCQPPACDSQKIHSPLTQSISCCGAGQVDLLMPNCPRLHPQPRHASLCCLGPHTEMMHNIINARACQPAATDSESDACLPSHCVRCRLAPSSPPPALPPPSAAPALLAKARLRGTLNETQTMSFLGATSRTRCTCNPGSQGWWRTCNCCRPGWKNNSTAPHTHALGPCARRLYAKCAPCRCSAWVLPHLRLLIQVAAQVRLHSLPQAWRGRKWMVGSK